MGCLPIVRDHKVVGRARGKVRDRRGDVEIRFRDLHLLRTCGLALSTYCAVDSKQNHQKGKDTSKQ